MTTKRFKSFDKEFQLLADTSPMLVSVTKNPDDETDEQFIATHDRFIALDDLTKDKLAMPETATKIQSIGKLYNLNSIQISDVARAIRSYYFKELKLEEFPTFFAKEFPTDLTKAREISDQVIQKIINDTSVEKIYQAKIENIQLAEAIRNYPEVGEQLITSQKIELKNFHDLVRPSIKNWLADYVFLLGYENHDAIERGNYLFHTTNTRRLSDLDREKLAYILKAFDEKFPIAINKEKQQIIFNFPAKIPAGIPQQYAPTINKRVQQPSNPLINKQFAPSPKSVPSPADDYIVRPLPKGEVESSRQFLARKNPTAPPDIYETYRIQRPAPEQKLSAGKIFSAPKNSNIQESKFDFPQKMPFEKEKEEDKPASLPPYRITSSATRNAPNNNQPPINPNNIIDLKNKT